MRKRGNIQKKNIISLIYWRNNFVSFKLYFRYYLEPASPLKSINTSMSQQQQQQPSLINGISSKSNHNNSTDNNLAVLKLTPPAANNRHHHRTHHNGLQNGHEHNNNNINNNNNNSNNNFFSNHLNGTSTNGSSHNGSIKSDNSNDFVADFSKASIYHSNNSLNSTGSGGGQVNGKITNGHSETSITTAKTNSDLNANFADFENNKIFNAAGKNFIRIVRKIIITNARIINELNFKKFLPLFLSVSIKLTWTCLFLFLEEYYKFNNNNNNSSIQWNIWQHFQWPNNFNNQPEQNRWSKSLL